MNKETLEKIVTLAKEYIELDEKHPYGAFISKEEIVREVLQTAEEARAELPNALEWTTEPPTVEGWYWAKPKDVTYNEYGDDIYRIWNDHGKSIQIVYVNDGLLVTVVDHDDFYVVGDFSHWLGPLSEPESPNP